MEMEERNYQKNLSCKLEMDGGDFCCWDGELWRHKEERKRKRKERRKERGKQTNQNEFRNTQLNDSVPPRRRQ
jgi:hypothetical protein